MTIRDGPPFLKGRGRGWVGFRKRQVAWLELAYLPPTPPFQGGEQPTSGPQAAPSTRAKIVSTCFR